MEPVVQPAAGDRDDAGEDGSLIRWMLGLTPAERLQVLQGFVDSVSELRRDPAAPVQRRA